MIKRNFGDLLEAVRNVHVDQKNKPTIESLETGDTLNTQSQKQVYTRTLSDLCYRYNKYSKENLLRNSFLSFLFVCFAIWKL